MLHARGENHDEKLIETTTLSVTQEAPRMMNEPLADCVVESRILGDDEGKDSGNESAEADSDSEDKREENFRKLQNSLVGMNVSGKSYWRKITIHGQYHRGIIIIFSLKCPHLIADLSMMFEGLCSRCANWGRRRNILECGIVSFSLER
jgi:hypothetical protein